MNEAFRAAAPDGLPPFITLDQEGGAVERLTEDVGFAEIPQRGAGRARADRRRRRRRSTRRWRARIADLGFTVNFGPVVDLAINPNNQVIAKFGRAFGKTADVVVPYAEAFVEGAPRGGGADRAQAFSRARVEHGGQPRGFRRHHRRPGRRASSIPIATMIADGLADFVMVGHLIDTDVDGRAGCRRASRRSGSPACCASELGYTASSSRDDLEMGAIRDHFKLREAVVQAVDGRDGRAAVLQYRRLPRRARRTRCATFS